jgi:hypothetical protein
VRVSKALDDLTKAMNYESVKKVVSRVAEGVTFSVVRMSFGRRVDLMRQVRDLAKEIEFLEAGKAPGEKMDAALLQAEIDRLFLQWGLQQISGLVLDGAEATPTALAESGPEDLFREALAAVQAEIGLSAEERKN